MNRSKKCLVVLISILILVLAVTVLVACNNLNNPSTPNNQKGDDSEQDKNQNQGSDNLAKPTVTVEANGGTVGNFIVNDDNSLTPPKPVPIKDGYVFLGWYKDADCTMIWDFFIDRVTENITLYAKWVTVEEFNCPKCFVTFDTNGGSTVEPMEVGMDAMLQRPNDPIKEGYNFAGWYNSAYCLVEWNFETDIVTTNMTLYAKWLKTSPLTFYYQLNDDAQTYKVTGVESGTETNLVIPSTYNGKPVTAIGEYAFYNYGSIRNLTIPESIKTIEAYAFENCYGLVDVYYMGNMADWCGIEFSNNCATPMLYAKNIYIDNELIGEKLVIPNGVTRIETFAFNSFSSIVKVVLPASVKSIGKHAFGDCHNLTDVYYTGELADWCSIVFDNSAANPLYNTCNLYINNERIVDLVLPDTVTRINEFAFCRLNSIISLTISDKVISIDRSAFSYCKNLKEIRFTGTVEQWYAIEIHNSWLSLTPVSKIICTDGEVDI